jgi:hypothetical protein
MCKEVDFLRRGREVREEGEYIGRGLRRFIRGSISYNDAGKRAAKWKRDENVLEG